MPIIDPPHWIRNRSRDSKAPPPQSVASLKIEVPSWKNNSPRFHGLFNYDSRAYRVVCTRRLPDRTTATRPQLLPSSSTWTTTLSPPLLLLYRRYRLVASSARQRDRETERERGRTRTLRYGIGVGVTVNGGLVVGTIGERLVAA